MLPQSVQTLEQQAKRAYEQYSNQKDDLAKNTFMTSMKEQNEVLFYKVSIETVCDLFRCTADFLQLLRDHTEEMFSIIYTPTEGDAIQNFSRAFRRPEGCFLNINDVDRVHHDLAQWGRPEDIDYIVVTGAYLPKRQLPNRPRKSLNHIQMGKKFWVSGIRVAVVS